MNQPKSNPAKTVLTISVGFLIVFAITKWQWSLNVAIIVGLIGVLSNYLSEKIEFLWMKLTWVLSKIVPNILLSALFFLFLFPVAVLSRIFGKKDPLNLKNTKPSMFHTGDNVFSKSSFEKPW